MKIIYILILLYTLDSYSKQCIRDKSACPFFWTSNGRYCISENGERILKDDFQTNNNNDLDSTEKKHNKYINNESEPIWPCNDGEAILSEMLQIKPKPWKGISLSGSVNPYSGDVVPYTI